MDRYYGQYRRILNHGRITFPKKYSRDFRKSGIFTNEIFEEDFRYLFLFPEKFLTEIPGRIEYQVYGLDRQNRLLIPKELRNYAGLRENVVITGCINWMELWNPEEFRYWIKVYEPRSSEIAEHVYDLYGESQKQVITVKPP